MSDHTTSGDAAEGEARAAEIRRDVEAADARRAEEEAATAQQAVEEARRQEEEAKAHAREQREDADEARVAARSAREIADDDAARADTAPRSSSVSGGAVASPGLGAETPPKAVAAASADAGASPAAEGADAGGSPPLQERPEVLIGAAFAGAFVFARVLKRLVD